MKVTQLHEIVNTATKEVLGESVILSEDLSNVVDVGNAIFDAEKVDNYVKKLVDKIGKTIFNDRLYSGGVPSVLIDSWEFGSVLQKISTNLPDAIENNSWNLNDGDTYSTDVFKAPVVNAQFFNSKVTFEIQMSFTELQLKSAFNSAEELHGFIAMLHTSVENSMTVKLDSLIMRAINNMIAETFYDEFISKGTNYKNEIGVKAINLLSLFNKHFPSSEAIDSKNCLVNESFIRFATNYINVISDRITKISTLYNVGQQARFTPKADQRCVLISELSNSINTFLLSNVFNSEKINIISHDSVPYFQGSGLSYDFDDITKINVSKTSSGKTVNEITGIVGLLFDKNAVAVSNLNRRTTSHYNARGEFYNNWFKADGQYINDLNENFIVFYIADKDVLSSNLTRDKK